MLKMTIDNEEVLSNNDISIKEEILSPSSTILNNVYPKTWEQDKDYVSRFYYPKDYSKLNIQNFSVEPEEAGTTIQINESATLTDVDTSKESRVLRLLGNTSQVQYTGKNILDKSLISHTSVTQLDTGIKLTDAWANNIMTNANVMSMLKPNTTYTCRAIVNIKSRPSTITENQVNKIALYRSSPSGFAGVVSVPNSDTIPLNTDTPLRTTFTTPSDLTGFNMLGYTYRASSGASGVIEFKELMIVEGRYTLDNFPSYEPYVGETASPNPSYPSPVNVVSGDNEIKINGKNLAPSDWANNFVNACNTPTLANITTKDNRNCLYYKVNAGYGDYPHKNFTLGMTFKENTQYTISYEAYKTSSTQKCVVVAYTDGTTTIGPTFNNIDTWERQTITTTANKTIDYVYVGYYSGDTYIDIDTWQIEEGTQATTYEPYIGNTYPINLGDIELCKIGTYQDYIYKDNGSWYLHKEVGKAVLDGSENWAIQSTWSSVGNVTNAFYIVKPSDLDATKGCYCNYLEYKNNVAAFLSTDEYGITYSSSLIVRMPKSLTDGNALKTWLASNNMVVYYVLATPTNTLIEDTNLIEQLESLSS